MARSSSRIGRATLACAAFALASMLASCVSVPSDAPSNADAFVEAARQVLAQHPEPATLERGAWPDALEAVSPTTLVVTDEGLFIVTSRRFTEEAGYFVPRDASAAPPAGGDPELRPISRGLFAFHTRG